MKSIFLLPALVLTFAALCGHSKGGETPEFILEAEKAHGVHAWWNARAVSGIYTYGSSRRATPDSARFYFEAHGSRARYEEAGKTVIFDGKTTWATPADSASPALRFHVLTWPWFLMQPFKTRGEGSELSDVKPMELGGKRYLTAKQTFAPGEGDTPDDWYRLFIDPQTKRLEANGYIVTFFRSKEEAEKQPSVLFYKDYEEIKGVLLSTRYELWYWSPDSGLVGEEPKSRGKWRDLRVHEQVDEELFLVPEGAVEVKMP